MRYIEVWRQNKQMPKQEQKKEDSVRSAEQKVYRLALQFTGLCHERGGNKDLPDCTTCKRCNKLGRGTVECYLKGRLESNHDGVKVDKEFGRQCLYHTRRCPLKDHECVVMLQVVDFLGRIDPTGIYEPEITKIGKLVKA